MRGKRALALALLAASRPLSAAEAPSALPLSGRVFSDVYFPLSNAGTTDYPDVSASAWLQGDPRLGENGYARFILQADQIASVNPSAFGGPVQQSRFRVREGYAGYAKSGWDLRLGQQIIPWGKSDAINPTDFLTAKDYTFFNPDDEVRRLGAVIAAASWTPDQGNSPLTFTVVVTPIAPQSILLIPPDVVPAGITAGTTAQTQTLGKTEGAFKVAYAASKWDASLLAFQGFNHIPELALLGSVSQSGATVGEVYHSIRAAGGDFSLTHGKWIFRAEGAYVWTQNDSGTNPLIEPSHADAVLGVERPLGDDFRIQAQFVERYIPNSSPATSLAGPDPVTTEVEQGIATANALLLGYQFQWRPSATFRFAYSNDANGLDAEIFVVGNIVGGDYLALPKISYHWTDALKTTFGMQYYGGPTNRPLGAMQAYNSVFTEAKYSF